MVNVRAKGQPYQYTRAETWFDLPTDRVLVPLWADSLS